MYQGNKHILNIFLCGYYNLNNSPSSEMLMIKNDDPKASCAEECISDDALLANCEQLLKRVPSMETEYKVSCYNHG